MSKISLLAPAKINLFLHINARRADGYHDIESLVVFAELADALTFKKSEHFKLTVRGEFADSTGTNEANLVIKAAKSLKSYSGYAGAANIDLVKNIPVGAGLGGGSTDAAATLRGLNDLWELKLCESELLALTTPLGADVAMCLAQTPLIAHGIGNEITPLNYCLPEIHAVLVYPRILSLTSDVYARFKATKPAPHWDIHHADEFWAKLKATSNHLQPSAIEVNHPIANVIAALHALEPTPELVRMTGSGACCFALYKSSAHAKKAANIIKATFPQWWVKAEQLRS